MDSLLIPLVVCALMNLGDRTQYQVLALAERFGRNAEVLAGILFATFLNAALSATAGWVLAPMLNQKGRLLLLAFALLWGTVALLFSARPHIAPVVGRPGAFLTSFFGLAILMLGDKAQFLVLAVAGWSGNAPLAALGGALGSLAALAPVVTLRGAFFRPVPLPWVRRAVGVLVLLPGLFVLLSALQRP